MRRAHYGVCCPLLTRGCSLLLQVVPIKRVGDPFYREIELSARTLAALKASIAHEFGVPEDEIHTLLRDGQVLLTHDAQVAQLSQANRIEFSLQVDTPTTSTTRSSSRIAEAPSRINANAGATDANATTITAGDRAFLADV